MASKAKWTVRSVQLLGNALSPAVNERGCAPRYEPSNPSLWTTQDQTNVVVINALTAEKGVNLRVNFAGKGWRDPISGKLSKSYAELNVMETYGRGSGWTRMAVTDDLSYKAGADEQLLSCDFTNVSLKHFATSGPVRAADEPWAFVLTLGFHFVLKPFSRSDFAVNEEILVDGKPWDGNEGLEQGDFTLHDYPIPIELYAICPALPRFLRLEGVPINLLRFALGPKNGKILPDMNQPYLTAVTNRVFDSGFVYERNHGSYAYTSGAGRPFELGKFLRIWTVLMGTAPEETQKLYNLRYERSKPKVNCFDQTGILGLCMGLACQNAKDRDSLIPIFMRPFGFLRDTPLVGFSIDENGNRQDCNNPFATEAAPGLHIDKLDEHRSHFGSHVFLQFRDLVYDACAGPYIGRGDLDHYVVTAIDREQGSHPLSFWNNPPDEKEKCHGNRKEEWDDSDGSIYRYTGTTKDVRKSSGKEGNLSEEHGGILGELDNMMNGSYSWYKTPEDLNLQLDEKDFSLDADKLGSSLVELSQKTKFLFPIQQASSPIKDTDAGDINENAGRQGEVSWVLTGLDGAQVYLDWRILPDFQKAAAERMGMYGDGDLGGGPSADDLAQKRIVSVSMDGLAHSTALVGRNLLYCFGSGLQTAQTADTLEKVLKLSLSKEHAEVKVGNRSANRSDHQIIKTKVGTKTTYSVQAENVLDVDWSYTSGNVFLLDYQVYKNNTRPDLKSQATRDEGEDDLPDLYRFEFYGREAGTDTFKLVFYDRSYNDPAYRYITFEVEA
ncbi:hypothetical protein EK21DRAFT_93796 [Setomelanomma holmii]|uniref:Uncharacterized protein n=1 Tax=Setomelanomma holmii TaxID=210430 RepID=A0A9P4GY53_9PLEO|nr:hypothetical protein EK21DRAFT_93796 [Setomelanomma holmii]